MRAAIIAGTALALIVVVIWVTLEPAPSTPVITADTPTVFEKQDRESEPEVAGGGRQAMPQLDPGRLSEKGYELDPEVQAMAKEAGLTPACLIATLKEQIHQVPMQEGICQTREQDRQRATHEPSVLVGANHPYTDYSDTELESLSVADPKAAIVLARRSDSDAEAKKMYERAVALSWVADPLIEWMTFRDTGGLLYENGVLNVEAAKAGYQIYLTAAAIDGEEDPIVETYERELKNAGVDLRTIQRAATEQVVHLRQERQSLTGGERS